MKKTLVLLGTLFMMTLLFAQEEVTIYTYDSMGWINDKVVTQFEKENNCKVKVVKFSSTGNIVARLKMEKKHNKADLVIGVTPVMLNALKKEDLLVSYKSKFIKNIKEKEIIFDNEFYVTPYDYGAIAIVYNPENMKSIPKNFKDLTKLKKKLIIEDPRTSTTGQDFLLWTIAVYGENWEQYWKELKPAILTVAPGWSEAFSKFEAGEAPMMVSYGTDGAYSYQYYKSTKYKALIPDDGGFIEVEGVGIVNGSKNIELSKKFIDFMLGNKFQKEIPLNQWMFPVTNIKLPESFKYAVSPKKVVLVSGEEISKNMKKWLGKWEKIME
ncbi:thiamine ABC transporter substrate-binding protein [Haliovirga abyssi]|uniref:ABC transporter substrate-binding protein n=1 Tax=Haliovirga abyssi TaxID=2996794 RepID=A0AAU9D6P9_9FUSO|nr:thiamine ABC transporter substrate-binding protein [Haliovirga abyssi]BDU50223.1 ABC transporter substrate-binding protein [Haliovirga abyssi]